MEVKLHYFRGHGSTMTVAVKKSSIAQKAYNCQIHSEMEENFFTAIAMVLPRSRK